MENSSFIYKFYYGWWKNIDKTIFLIIILLFTLGLFFSLASTSLIASDKLDTNSYFFFFFTFISKIIFFSACFKSSKCSYLFYFLIL